MANENLKNALQNAGLTPEEFAQVIRVDPKSVQRWVAGTTVPYPRHRAAISRALGLSEHELWPDEIPAPAADTGAREHSPIAGNEITGTWAYATDETAPDPVAIIENSDGAIEILDNGTAIDLTTTLVDALTEQANNGRHVRLLTCAPTRRLEPLAGHKNVELRVIHGSIGHSLLLVSDTMLLTVNLTGEANQPPLLLKLTLIADGGVFERLVENLDALWNDAEETITNPEQLDAYLTDTGDWDEDVEEDLPNEPEPDELRATDSSHAAEPARTPTKSEPEPTPRRWPRRPD